MTDEQVHDDFWAQVAELRKQAKPSIVLVSITTARELLGHDVVSAMLWRDHLRTANRARARTRHPARKR